MLCSHGLVPVDQTCLDFSNCDSSSLERNDRIPNLAIKPPHRIRRRRRSWTMMWWMSTMMIDFRVSGVCIGVVAIGSMIRFFVMVFAVVGVVILCNFGFFENLIRRICEKGSFVFVCFVEVLSR